MSKLLAMIMSKKPQYMNLSVIGTPTISSGVVSGFAGGNYVKLGNNNFYNNKFAIKIKFTTGTITQNNHIIRSGNDFYIRINNSNKRIVFGATNTTDWDIANQINGITDIANNTTYYIIFSFDGNKYIISLSTDDINYTEEIVVNSSLIINNTSDIIFGYALNSSGSYFQGSIDIYNSYIKLGNTKYNYQFTKPLTVVGSPTITDGVVSGFSSSDYLSLNNQINYSLYPELTFEIITGATNVAQIIYDDVRVNSNPTTYNGLAIVISGAGKLGLTMGAGNSWEINTVGTTILLSNTKYYLKLSFNGASWILKSSIDNKNWVQEIKSNKSSYPTSPNYAIICGVSRNIGAFKGSINIPNCYIIQNGTKYIFTLP